MCLTLVLSLLRSWSPGGGQRSEWTADEGRDEGPLKPPGFTFLNRAAHTPDLSVLQRNTLFTCELSVCVCVCVRLSLATLHSSQLTMGTVRTCTFFSPWKHGSIPWSHGTQLIPWVHIGLNETALACVRGRETEEYCISRTKMFPFRGEKVEKVRPFYECVSSFLSQLEVCVCSCVLSIHSMWREVDCVRKEQKKGRNVQLDFFCVLC